MAIPSDCTSPVVVAIITCALTSIGWYVNNSFAKSRASRKETRTIVDSLNELFDKLIKAASGYYCSGLTETQETSRQEIHAHMSRLAQLIDRLEKLDPTSRLNQRLVPLFEAITGGDFESANVKRGDVGTEKHKRIILLADNVRNECEDWYRRYYEDK